MYAVNNKIFLYLVPGPSNAENGTFASNRKTRGIDVKKHVSPWGKTKKIKKEEGAINEKEAVMGSSRWKG
ncbi:MAG: hypothetical protein D3917_10210 [Candidatus Electrothrix sp. AX5]|nr:hypothetical protein [Candidatus Electrothrix sp. AX5]